MTKNRQILRRRQSYSLSLFSAISILKSPKHDTTDVFLHPTKQLLPAVFDGICKSLGDQKSYNNLLYSFEFIRNTARVS